jgi:hypothetical protein
MRPQAATATQLRQGSRPNLQDVCNERLPCVRKRNLPGMLFGHAAHATRVMQACLPLLCNVGIYNRTMSACSLSSARAALAMNAGKCPARPLGCLSMFMADTPYAGGLRKTVCATALVPDFGWIHFNFDSTEEDSDLIYDYQDDHGRPDLNAIQHTVGERVHREFARNKSAMQQQWQQQDICKPDNGFYAAVINCGYSWRLSSIAPAWAQRTYKCGAGCSESFIRHVRSVQTNCCPGAYDIAKRHDVHIVYIGTGSGCMHPDLEWQILLDSPGGTTHWPYPWLHEHVRKSIKIANMAEERLFEDAYDPAITDLLEDGIVIGPTRNARVGNKLPISDNVMAPRVGRNNEQQGIGLKQVLAFIDDVSGLEHCNGFALLGYLSARNVCGVLCVDFDTESG